LLSEQQLKDIKELQHICEEGESFQLKLNWDMLQARTERNDFFQYEDGKLVGFLGLYGFGNKVEVCGMVHPDFRRKGIFTELYRKAEEVMKERGYREILLNTPSSSQSGQGFLQTVPCTYAFSEHQMKWQQKELSLNHDVQLRPSTPEDLDIEISLDVQCFHFDENDAREFNERIRRESMEELYIIEYEGTSVGKVRVSHYGGEAWIYGFAIFPAYQGKGIGRKVLSNIILQEHEKGFPIFLEVEAKNAHALKLYESCGFASYHSQDYYQMRIPF